ncbi:MAG: TetR/AcrR family transcriptional regulator [Pseudomonas sp.]|uniref:TetR/AcrR family transcriptional regulator n=1 Tax=Pseudomonas sp. TaxID=306 RepID=UPI003D6F7389
MRDLASYLGLHAGSLYHHIENKQALLFELIETGLSDLLLDTTHRMKGARSPGKRLRLFIQAFVAFNFSERNKLALITREFANLSEEQKDQIQKLKDKYSSLLGAIISDEYGKAGMSAHDIRWTANTVIVLLFGQSQWYNEEMTEAQLTDALTSLATCIIENHKPTHKTVGASLLAKNI